MKTVHLLCRPLPPVWMTPCGITGLGTFSPEEVVNGSQSVPEAKCLPDVFLKSFLRPLLPHQVKGLGVVGEGISAGFQIDFLSLFRCILAYVFRKGSSSTGFGSGWERYCSKTVSN